MNPDLSVFPGVRLNLSYVLQFLYRLAFATLFFRYVSVVMPPESIPTLRRSHSSTGTSCIDPYDQAEQGFCLGLKDLSRAEQPPKTRKPLSLRYSLRSSDSILAGTAREAYELGLTDRAKYPLPHQSKSHRVTAIQSLSRLFQDSHPRLRHGEQNATFACISSLDSPLFSGELK
jgi:hypothetical protein